MSRGGDWLTDTLTFSIFYPAGQSFHSFGIVLRQSIALVSQSLFVSHKEEVEKASFQFWPRGDQSPAAPKSIFSVTHYLKVFKSLSWWVGSFSMKRNELPSQICFQSIEKISGVCRQVPHCVLGSCETGHCLSQTVLHKTLILISAAESQPYKGQNPITFKGPICWSQWWNFD